MLKKIFGTKASAPTSTAPTASPSAAAPHDTFVRAMPKDAGRRLPREFRDLTKLIAAKGLVGYSQLSLVDDSMHQWSVRLHLDEGTLAADLKTYGAHHGQDYLQLRVTFPNDYPHQPPMVWLQSPVLEYRTGFVSRGAICTEMLVTTGGSNGWRSDYTMEAVLVTLKANFQDPEAKGRINNITKTSAYTQDQAVGGLARARKQHAGGHFVESTRPISAPPAPSVPPPPSVAAPAVLPPAAPVSFPACIADLTVEGHLNGITAPQLLQNATGQRFVAKSDPAASHGLVVNEFQVLKAYEALGIKVPRAQMYTTSSGRSLLTEFIPGTELRDLTGVARQQAEARVRQGFVVDALLGGWDAVGAYGDNIIVTPHGEVYRIDNGCGYDRRARGGTKRADQFDGTLGDLNTLRTVRDGYSTVRHAIYHSVTDADIRAQRDAIKGKKEALFAVVPAQHRATMQKRWNALMAW